MPSYYRDPSAPATNVPRRVGVVALVERDGRFLVERRADDDGSWAFVGGGIDDDESALDALAREIREETGYTVEDATLAGVFSDPARVVEYPDGNVCRLLSLAFKVRIAESTAPVLSDESLEMRFVTSAELDELDLWPVHIPIRDALLTARDGPVVA